eukprot:Lankesteria_metandrocarpae@DN4455_c0_g1_i4.p2
MEEAAVHEEFLEKLQSDVDKLKQKRSLEVDAQQHVRKLIQNIKMVQRDAENQKVKDLNLLVDLGHSTYADAYVPDTSRLFVETELGLYVDFTLDEALLFLVKKDSYCGQRVEYSKLECAKAIAHMRLYKDLLGHLIT